MIDSPGPEFQDPMICFCRWVTQTQIQQAVRNGATTLYDIQAETGASTGCGGCECEVLEILENELKTSAQKP